MADYTQTVLFGPKDGLSSGDPLKLARGTEVDAELAAIATAISTKYDDTDIASQAQVEAETSNAVLVTPLRLAQWSDANGGIVGDLQALSSPGGDRILFWDNSNPNPGQFLAIGAGLAISGTTLSSDIASLEGSINHDSLVGFVGNEHINHTSVVLTAGVGLSGGGDISASRTFNLDIPGTTLMPNVIDSAADSLIMYDASAGVHYRVPINTVTSSDTGFVTTGRTLTAGVGLTGGGDLSANRTFDLDTANSRNVDHGAVSINAGTGLSGGGTIAATRTLNLVAATESAIGGVERATQGEVDAGTDTTRYVTPATLNNFSGLPSGIEFASKATDETVNNSTTFQNDDDLTFTNIPTGWYRIDMRILVRDVAVSNCGFKFDFSTTGVGSAVFHARHDTFSGAAAPATDLIGTLTDDFIFSSLSNGSATDDIVVTGYIDVTAGTNSITLRWAQNTAQVGDLDVEANSFIALTRLGAT